jgi:NADH-ubiquinone oxidoreductase chain 5
LGLPADNLASRLVPELKKNLLVALRRDSQQKCTAGVYLLMRASPLIEYSSTVLILCLWIGAITSVFSSLIGLFQQDIKKVIAYSTMSQLGMMVIAVGLSSYNVALFHLVNHAFKL